MTDDEARRILAKSRTAATIGAILLFVLALLVQFAPQTGSAHPPSPDPWKAIKALLLSMWLILPPIWFWFEYHIFFHHLSADERQSLKEYQEISRNVWAGVAALFALIYFGESK